MPQQHLLYLCNPGCLRVALRVRNLQSSLRFKLILITPILEIVIFINNFQNRSNRLSWLKTGTFYITITFVVTNFLFRDLSLQIVFTHHKKVAVTKNRSVIANHWNISDTIQLTRLSERTELYFFFLLLLKYKC